MDYKRFVYQVRWETALDSTDEVTELIESTIEALGSLLSETNRLDMAGHLPRPLSEALLQRERVSKRNFEFKNLDSKVGCKGDSDELYRFDNILTVCKIFNDFIDAKQRQSLRQNLPQSLGSVFSTPIRRTRPQSTRAYPAVTARGSRGDYPGRQLQNVRHS
jgi:uncharacterized protein (DUF2267 family)